MRQYGISDKFQVATIGEFCYTIPHGKVGLLNSRNVVHTGEQSFLLLRQEDWEALYAGEDGDLSRIGSKICEGDNAFLKEPLLPTKGEGHLSTFDVSMALPATFDRTMVYAVLANCDAPTNVEYGLTFINPGSIFKRHFSCQDLGLLQLYMVLSFIMSILAFNSFRKQRHFCKTMPIRNALHLAGAFQLLNVFFVTLHLFAYARDGLGLSALRYLGALCAVAGAIFLSLVLGLLAGTHTLFQLTTAGADGDGEQMPLTSKLYAALATLFFLWTETRYRFTYIARLQMGVKLGGFGLSPYSAFYGTLPGLLFIHFTAALGALFVTQATRAATAMRAREQLSPELLAFHRSLLASGIIFYFLPLTPLILSAFLPIRHLEVQTLIAANFLPLLLLDEVIVRIATKSLQQGKGLILRTTAQAKLEALEDI